MCVGNSTPSPGNTREVWGVPLTAPSLFCFPQQEKETLLALERRFCALTGSAAFPKGSSTFQEVRGV